MPRPAIRYDYASIRVLVPQAGPVVYRIYDGDVLVYAGASLHPRSRLLRHLRHGRVAGTLVELEFPRNPTAMLRAERAAIAEGSTHNRTGAGRHEQWRVRKCAVETRLQ